MISLPANFSLFTILSIVTMQCPYANGFVLHNKQTFLPNTLNLYPVDSMASAVLDVSNLVATVSADIDNIPTDNFAEVFTGGIAVMLGGVASSLIVGVFLEFGGEKYDNAISDSYGDESLDLNVPDISKWTDEQRAEFNDLSKKFLEDKISPSGQELADFMNQFKNNDNFSSSAVNESTKSTEGATQSQAEKELSLFSDYDD